jgi:hypothetical protein
MTTSSHESAPARIDGPAPDLGWSLAVVLQRWHERVEELLADVPHGSRGYHVLVACAESEASTQAAGPCCIVRGERWFTGPSQASDCEAAGQARAWDQPTSGTLVQSGLAASAINNIRYFDELNIDIKNCLC